MDIGLREWLIIIGIIVIAAILIDGWRRIRGGGKNKLRLDRSLSQYYESSQEPHITFSESTTNASTNKHDVEDMPFLSTKEPDILTENTEQQINLNLSNNPPENKSTPTDQQEKNNTAPIEEVLIINVVSRHPDGFKGPALLQNILESGLRFGEMDIFHRHESMTGNGERYFSMANGVKPGTFDLDDIDHFSTRAVSFFLGLPGPKHPKRAFDVMLAAARKLSSELEGDLQDDHHSIMTSQTIEHYRQRIVDFERRKLKAKRY